MRAEALVVLGIFAIVIIGGVLLFTHIDYEQRTQDTRFNDWTAQCHKDGGAVQITALRGSTQSYECFKNGQIINHVN